MSVRSRYSATSYLNTRATSPKVTPRVCKTCIYKVQSEGGKAVSHIGQKQTLLLTPTQAKRLERLQKQPALTETPMKKPDEKPKGLLRRFGDYVAKNQADLKAAGETSLMEDLSDMGKKMFNQAGQLGEEETARIRNLSGTSGTQRKESDDEVIDFLIGKRGGKK